MEVKTFEAFSMKDAVKSVKKALGQDAVILSSKEKPAPGGKGILYELTAAAAQNSRASGASARANAEGLTHAQENVAESLTKLTMRVNTLQETSATKRQVEAIENGLYELKLLLLETLRQKDGSLIQDLPLAMATIERQLKLMGVDGTNIAELLKHLRSLPSPESTGHVNPEADEEYYKAQAIRFMMKRIKIAPRWTVLSGTTAVQAIVGPSGAGKSSLIAKIAAHYHLKEKNKVRVVSFDNHRLAASDQMRVFCKIIGVPFSAVADASELPKLVAEHNDCELILIDTAGLSPKSSSGIEGLEALKQQAIAVDFHLCLAVTEKEQQLDLSIRSFSKLGLQSLVFTKLDECWSFGEIYNLSKKWSLPLSFFSIGQEIPDDLERATRERVIEKIFGL
jgi:flagellar biosynthesis protein FlhF